MEESKKNSKVLIDYPIHDPDYSTFLQHMSVFSAFAQSKTNTEEDN